MEAFDVKFGLAQGMTKLSWHRIQPGVLISTAEEITAVSARNEVVGVQVQLQASSDFTLNLSRDNWLHPLGLKPRVRLDVAFDDELEGGVSAFPIGYINGDSGVQWQEYLDRSGTAIVQAHRPHAVYIRLHVPKDVSPGLYEGKVTAYQQQGWEDEQQIWQGTIHLQVYSAVLPDVADYSFHLDLWQHFTSLARYYHVPLWGDEHFELIDRYCASVAALGQKAITVVATEVPWSGQQCHRDVNEPAYMFEHAVIDVSRDAAGELHFSYDKLARLLAIAAKHGIDQEIEVFGLLNIWVDEPFGFGKVAPDGADAIRIRCFDETTRTMTYLRTEAEIGQFVTALHDYLQRENLLDRVRILADEPSDVDLFNKRLGFIKEGAPGFQYKVAVNHFEFMEDAPPEMVDCVPQIAYACKDYALTQKITEDLRKRNGRMSWYVCCNPPIPNNFLHSPLVESQLVGWLTYYLKLDGFLRWNFCLWPDDPWQKAGWRFPQFPAGDLFFVLPGKDGKPVETLRYEAMRTAVQDYELLKLVEKQLPDSESDPLMQQVFEQILNTDNIEDFANVWTVKADSLYSLDPVDYQQARELLLQGLESVKQD